MLIAVSGSQGSGKSTLLNALAENGHPIITRKTSRSILSDWGVTLSEVNNQHDLTIKFQDEITKRKHEDELEAINSDEVWFTERSHTDLFVYALGSLGKDNEYSEWLDQYYHTCVDYNKDYALQIYLTAGHFTVASDGVRGSNQHYSRMIDLVMDYYMKDMMHHHQQLYIIDNSDLEKRKQQCENLVRRLTLPDKEV